MPSTCFSLRIWWGFWVLERIRSEDLAGILILERIWSKDSIKILGFHEDAKRRLGKRIDI